MCFELVMELELEACISWEEIVVFVDVVAGVEDKIELFVLLECLLVLVGVGIGVGVGATPSVYTLT